MKTRTKQYVELHFIGALTSEPEIREIPSRTQLKKLPSGCFGYRFFERQETTAEDGEVLLGNPRNYSGNYLFGKVKTLEDLKKENPPQRKIIRRMERSGLDKVVETKMGTYELFSERDTLIED